MQFSRLQGNRKDNLVLPLMNAGEGEGSWKTPRFTRRFHELVDSIPSKEACLQMVTLFSDSLMLRLFMRHPNGDVQEAVKCVGAGREVRAGGVDFRVVVIRVN